MPVNHLEIPTADWEDAKAFFKANPKEIKYRKSQTLAAKKLGKDHSHSFFHIERKIYVVNNTKHHVPEPDAGVGGFSRVKLAFDEQGNRFVIKVEYRVSCKNLQTIDSIQRELGLVISDRIARKVNKHNEESGFLKIGLAETDKIQPIPVTEKLYTVLPYLGDRELFSELLDIPQSKNIVLSEDEKLLLVFKAMLSVLRLHQKGIVHADIKPENFMVSGEGVNRRLTAIDFDFSVRISPDQPFFIKDSAPGSFEYLAPEAQNYCQYSFASDVYAFGILLWKLQVKQEYYLKLISVGPQNRPSLLQAMEKIALHLYLVISQNFGSSLEAEIIKALQEFELNKQQQPKSKAPQRAYLPKKEAASISSIPLPNAPTDGEDWVKEASFMLTIDP